jgi:hypothetical protein
MVTRLFCLFVLLLVARVATAQMRYEHSLSLSGGLYAASGIGTNFTYAGRYDYFMFGGRYFVEGAIGFGTLHSGVINAVSKARLFPTDELLTYEFGVAFDAAPAGNIPFVLLGVAGVRQGGETSFAGVIGLGKRIPISGISGPTGFGIRYDIRDQIFSERVNNSDPFIAHNIVATVGIQVYF